MTTSSKERTSHVIKFLRGFPSLQDLELDLINPSLPSSDILIKILEPHISSLDEIDLNLLPNLQRLVFSGPIFLKNRFEELLYKTLQDRDVTGIATTQKDVRPLLFFELKSKEYHTYPYTTFTPEDREKYTSLVANGMHLKILVKAGYEHNVILLCDGNQKFISRTHKRIGKPIRFQMICNENK
ncbi:hypothetical protein CPB84DRAFT_1444819 [Gymnopilus junonius]|uniref:Uncharacterized protein n=1 Tax=Gymnopilus junonius TaxID=109634 RepID=A0A9P5P060_GYMJU|nr:hypothetical protein CPB84DRAFT_1444819 [Gymnopilus junonius]